MDLTGSWLGTYWQNGKPTRFEMTLAQAQNALSGCILDDNFMGASMLKGDVSGDNINFSKCYLAHIPYAVAYIGTLTEDKATMQGTWWAEPRCQGTWEAQRTGDDLMVDLKRRLTRQVSVEAGGDRPQAQTGNTQRRGCCLPGLSSCNGGSWGRSLSRSPL